MKLVIEENPNIEETEIRITCALMTPQLQEIISLIRLHTFSLSAKRNGEMHLLRLEDVYYFDSVDGHTFVYTKNEVYESDLRLYQLEQELEHTQFIRVSKSAIVNLEKLRSVKSAGNGRMFGRLDNEEQIVISRSYVPLLKKKLGLPGAAG